MEKSISPASATSQAATLERLQAQERSRRFDIAQPPLLRFLLVRLGPSATCCMLTHHHLLLDGWSLPPLLEELLTIQAGAALPPPVSYKRYLQWLSQRDREAAEIAWRKALAGLEGPTRLIPAHPGQATAEPERFEILLPPALATALERLARRAEVTLNTITQAAWGITLGVLAGSLDVVFGATVSGRPADLAGSEAMIGLLINTLPLRVKLDFNETALALLTRLQREQTALLDHQHLGLAEIQRLAGHGELFDTLLLFDSYPIAGKQREPAP